MQKAGVNRFVADRGGAPHHDGSTPATRWLHGIAIWVARCHQRKALKQLARVDRRLLQDIGVSKEDALREAAKPFWRR
jgi:uncharacterized protein YjiS (DUF1127 family)